jgi:hypothetical protein
MASWGSVDFSRLRRLQKKMEKLSRADFDKFCEDAAKELAARLLAKVIKRTPVGQYKGQSKTGGTLKRGWTAKTHQEAESSKGNKNAKAYADSLQVTKRGNIYELHVINPVEYAQYVEFGHRTRNHQGWVPGQFMMTIAADQVQQQAPQIVENKLNRLLREAFDGD